MPVHLYRVLKVGEQPRWFAIRIEFIDDRWAASCRESDETGQWSDAGSVVGPKFYGVSAEQAQRKMVEVLENAFDEVAPAARRVM